MPRQETIQKPEKLTLKNVQLMWCNFAGKEKMYNEKGNRVFHIRIDDPVLAKIIREDGWNLKELNKREPDDPDAWHLPVKVNLKPDNPYPPRIYKVTMDEQGVHPIKRLQLDATTAMLLDILRIQYADVTVSPYVWDYQGRQGITAYVEVLYAVTEENPLDTEWDDRFAGAIFDEPGPDDIEPDYE